MRDNWSEERKAAAATMRELSDWMDVTSVMGLLETVGYEFIWWFPEPDPKPNVQYHEGLMIATRLNDYLVSPYLDGRLQDGWVDEITAVMEQTARLAQYERPGGCLRVRFDVPASAAATWRSALRELVQQTGIDRHLPAHLAERERQAEGAA